MLMRSMKKTAHVIISGRVQGVWFRSSTKQQAESLNLTGWVRNTPDNKVEAIFEGDQEDITKIISWCHSGPSMAKVDDVQVKYVKNTEEFDEFTIRY